MTRHAAYWQPLIDSGQMVIFGPVLDGTGSWTFAPQHSGDSSGFVDLSGADFTRANLSPRPSYGRANRTMPACATGSARGQRVRCYPSPVMLVDDLRPSLGRRAACRRRKELWVADRAIEIDKQTAGRRSHERCQPGTGECLRHDQRTGTPYLVELCPAWPMPTISLHCGPPEAPDKGIGVPLTAGNQPWPRRRWWPPSASARAWTWGRLSNRTNLVVFAHGQGGYESYLDRLAHATHLRPAQLRRYLTNGPATCCPRQDWWAGPAASPCRYCGLA